MTAVVEVGGGIPSPAPDFDANCYISKVGLECGDAAIGINLRGPR
jgi:hypothetical protein